MVLGSVFFLMCLVTITVGGLGCIIWVLIDGVRNRKGIKEGIQEFEEQLKEEAEWEKKFHAYRRAQRKIANIRQLRLDFQKINDWLFGEMEICYNIESMPTYLRIFKCSMERKTAHIEEDECQMILLFARNEQDVVDYLNCYNILDPDASGLSTATTRYIYDGVYCPLQEVTGNLPEAIKHAQAAFIIDRRTGEKYQRENAA